MRPNVEPILAASAAYQNLISNTLWASQILRASFQAIVTGSTAAGTLQVQASNDRSSGAPPNTFQPTNWSNVGSAVSVSGAGAFIVPTLECSYEYLRLKYTPTGAGIQTVAPIADTGVRQAQTVTSIADTGALEVVIVTAPATASAAQADYFVLTGTTGVKTALWLDIDANGTAPTGAAYVAATNKIKVSIITGGTAAQNGTILRTAATTTVGYTAVDNGDGTVTYTQTLMGNCTNAARHNADDSGNGSFSFSGQVNGAASNLNSTYYTLSSINKVTKAQKNFYLWLNVNSQGVDPAPASKTAIPIAIAAGASANTIATAMRSALNALTNDFAATGSNAAVITTDVAFGSVTAAADSAAPTGFTFGSATAGVASNLNNKYFLLYNGGSTIAYYVWNNVDGIGTDPAVAGKTGIEIDFNAGSSAGTIGTALATAVAAVHGAADFGTSGTTTVTITNLVTGAFTPASDVSTGFTITLTTPTGTVAASIASKAL